MRRAIDGYTQLRQCEKLKQNRLFACMIMDNGKRNVFETSVVLIKWLDDGNHGIVLRKVTYKC